MLEYLQYSTEELGDNSTSEKPADACAVSTEGPGPSCTIRTSVLNRSILCVLTYGNLSSRKEKFSIFGGFRLEKEKAMSQCICLDAVRQV